MSSIQEIELTLVSTALIFGMDSIAAVDVEPYHFYDMRMQAAWRAMHALHDRREPVDTTTLEHELEISGIADPMGVIMPLLTSRNTTTDPEWHAEKIRHAWVARETRKACGDIVHDTSTQGDELLSRAYSMLAKIETNTVESAISIADLCKQRWKELQQIATDRLEGKKAITGEATGIAALDARIGGWQRGIVSIVAARPGMGKSSLGLSTAYEAMSSGRGVHVFSLEDIRASYTDRAFARTSGMSSEEIRGCDFTGEQIQSLSAAMRKMQHAENWIVDDRSGVTAIEIVRSVRRQAQVNNTKVVIIDYAQRLRWPDGCRSAHEALGQSITTLADAAKADGVAYVVMCQLNRNLESRVDKRPMLSDLRESGTLEEIAKCVIGLYRGSYYGKPTEGVDYEKGEPMPSDRDFARRIDLLILKNSNGRTETVRANWDGPSTRIW